MTMFKWGDRDSAPKRRSAKRRKADAASARLRKKASTGTVRRRKASG